MYKVPYPHWVGGGLSSLLGKNIKFGRGEGNIKDVGKKGKWEEISSPFYIKAVGKNIQWEGHWKFGEENQD